MKVAIVLFFFVQFSITAPFIASAIACHAAGHPDLHGKNGKYPLKIQNQILDPYGLHRVTDAEDISWLLEQKYLTPLQESRHYVIDSWLFRSGVTYRLVRPWVQVVLDDIASRFVTKFDVWLYISAALRDLPYQLALEGHSNKRRKIKGVSDANSLNDETQSTHLTGAAIDISKRVALRRGEEAPVLRNMFREEVIWLCGEFAALMADKKIIAIEEVRSNAFHIIVLPPEPSTELLAIPAPPPEKQIKTQDEPRPIKTKRVKKKRPR